LTVIVLEFEGHDALPLLAVERFGSELMGEYESNYVVGLVDFLEITQDSY